MRIPIRRLLLVAVLLLGGGGAVFVTAGTQAAVSASAPTSTTASTPVNSATPTTGPVPTTCTGPIVNSNDTITFCVSAPQAANVQLAFQNMLGLSPATDAFLMTKTASGIWYITVEPPAGANWYGYGFVVDGAHIADPSNRDIWSGVPTSFSPIGSWSMVMVPGPESQFMAETNVPHGAVATVDYYSQLGQTERRMEVYTPPGYNSHRAYPVLYLLHGAGGNDTDWTVNMRANYILDNLIAQRRAAPMIIVMPDTNVGSSFGLSTPVTGDQFVQQELMGTIVPYIEHNYRTLRGAQNRAIAGLSLGSLHARDAMFLDPTEFSCYGFFSNGGLSSAQITDLIQNHPDLIRDVVHADKARVIKQVWLTQGAEEPQVIPALTTRLAPTEAFFDQYHIKYTDVPGPSIGAIYGHVWDTWRKDLLAFAPRLFRDSRGHGRR